MDEEIRAKSKLKWNSIAKPLKGLGDFEEVVSQIAAIHGSALPDISKRVLVIMCSDNGIVDEGVTQSPQAVTAQMAELMGLKKSSACVLAAEAGCKVQPVDIGINADIKYRDDEGRELILDRKIRKGTRDFAIAPAMTEEETISAINVGRELAHKYKAEGYGLILVGEMGIGNTTTAAACIISMLALNIETYVGRGAGLDDAGLRKKKKLIKDAILKYGLDRNCHALKVLSHVGGFDIAGIAGLIIGGAECGIPVIIDGVITASAALIAEALAPGCSAYVIASHSGREAGIMPALEALDLKPLINGNMALGEGVGAVMALKLIDLAYALYKNGTTFGDIGLEQYKELSVGKA